MSSPPGQKLRKCVVGLAVGATLVSLGNESRATPGTHPPIVSTWDTGASSVNATFTGGLFPGGHLHFASYNSSFSSTSGKVSAQFGVHYVNYLAAQELPAANGGAGTAAFVFNAPLLGRHESGLPKLSLGFYLGIAPTLLIAGQYNYVWIPVAAGVAAPISPVPFLTIVPSFELAGGASFDTVVRAPEFKPSDIGTVIDPGGSIRFGQADIERLVADSIKYELQGSATMRGGVSASFHLGERIDLGTGVTLGNVGSLSAGKLAVFLGGTVQLHWDSVVPAVLPPNVRLERESCEDVEERWKLCPGSKRGIPQVPNAPPPEKASSPSAPSAPSAPSEGTVTPSSPASVPVE